MASFHSLRQEGARPADAGRLTVFPSRARLFALLALLLVATLAGWLMLARPAARPSFVQQTVGGETEASAPSGRWDANTRVAIDRTGVRLVDRGTTLRLGVAGAGSARWTAREHGISRKTPFGTRRS